MEQANNPTRKYRLYLERTKIDYHSTYKKGK